MHRIFCSNIPGVGVELKPDAREAEHLFKVFRARPGEAVEMLDGRGNRARGEVLPQRQIKVTACEHISEPAEKLHLCCALPRRQKLDALLKQATELGAWTIRPVHCERSVAEGNPRERWEVLLKEACKQSGNAYLPEIRCEQKLSAVLAELKAEGVDIFYGSVKPLPADPGAPVKARSKAVFIGPEGGFTDEEISEIEAAGGKPLNLGPHILRLETAAVAALAVLRFLSFICCFGIMALAISGCEQADMKKNPLFLKAEKLSSDGKFEDARRFLRQAVARYPESAEAYLALGKLCEEELDDKLEAIYCYRNFLQFSPAGDPRRESVEKFIAGLEKQLANEFLQKSEEVAKLKKDNHNLLTELNLAKRLIMSNQRKIKDLNAQLKAAQQRRGNNKRRMR